MVHRISEVDHRTKATETEGHHFYSSFACLEPHQLCAMAKSEILQKENAENAGG